MIFFSWLFSGFSAHATPLQDLGNPQHPLSCELLERRGLIENKVSCLNAFDNPEYLRKALKENSIYVQDDIPVPLLSYLHSYFHLVPAKEIIFVQQSQQNGPKQVWKRGNTLFFTQNATDTLLDNQLYGILAAQKDGAFDAQEMQIQIGYSNTLFEQLNELFLDREQATHLLKKYYKIDVLNGEEEDLEPFTTKELQKITKDLFDLPPHIVDTFHLKELAKAAEHRPLFHEGRKANAIYNSKKQRITISQNLFDIQSTDWDSTFFHEAGHAFWMGLAPSTQKKFVSLSFQERFHLQNWRPLAQACFLSAYSTESPEEDFAEHFAAFLEEPERFQNRCPQKYALYQNLIFKDVSYITQAHEHAKIFVESHSPDSDPPILKKPVSKSLFVEMKTVDQNSMLLEIEAKWLYDAHSGIADVSVRFENNEGEVIQELLEAKHLKNEQLGLYKASFVLERNQYKRSEMDLISFISTDVAGNTTVHSVDKEMQISVPGTKQNLKPHPIEPLSKEHHHIKQTFLKREKGESIYNIVLPVARESGLERITLYWGGEDEHSELSSYHHQAGSSETISFFQKEDKSYASIRTRVPEHLKSGTYWLNRVYLEYKQQSGFVAQISDIRLPHKGSQNLALKLKNPHEDRSKAELEANALRLNSIEHTKPNQSGGERSIVVHLPIEGLEKGELEAHISMIAPSGKRLYWYATPNTTEVTFSKGLYSVELPLAPHHERGIYILDEISLVEGYKLSEYRAGQTIFLCHNHKEKIQFKERGIQKTIEIKPEDDSEQF